MKVLIEFVLIFTSAVLFSEAKTNKIFCFYGSWATYRTGAGKFDLENIDVTRCTHVRYSFIGLNIDGSIKILDDWGDIQMGGFRRAVALKYRNANLKVLISMGGWNEGSEKYSHVCNNPALRANLVRNIYDFIIRWGFDGFDFDWEYPAQRGGAPSDYYAFIDFLRELREWFGTQFLITAVVGSTPEFILTSYNVSGMNVYLNYINLKTYDYNGPWNGRTGQNSPLYSHVMDPNRQFNIDATVQNWIQHGASPDKLIIGLAFYGQTFQLVNPNDNGLHAPTIGPGNSGPYTKEAGILMYMEICLEIRSGGWTINFDWEHMSPYMFKGDQWIGYDNADSIEIKTRYAVTNNLAGVMMWSIDFDDRSGLCGGGEFPLLRAIYDVIEK